MISFAVSIISSISPVVSSIMSIKCFKMCIRDRTNATKDYDVLLIGLTRNRDELYDRINKRVDTLINKGLVNEVQALMDMGLTRENISMKGIGYKEIDVYKRQS